MQTHRTGGEKLLRARQVYERLGISEATFYRRLRRGEFPPPVRDGSRITWWKQSVVDAEIENLMRRDAAE